MEEYKHKKRFCLDFKKYLEEYHDLYVQSQTLLLADVFENFQNRYLEIYELDPVRFLTALRLAWQAALKKTTVKLNLITGINILLMVEKCTRGGICHAIHWHVKTNSKYMKGYDKNTIFHILSIGMWMIYWDGDYVAYKWF